MIKTIPAIGLVIALSGCGGLAPEFEPAWLRQLIAEQRAQPVANPPAYVARQVYEQGVFYYLPPRCCDIWSELYDEEGELVCHPDGGITGTGDGQCPDLGALLSEEIVWRDPRG